MKTLLGFAILFLVLTGKESIAQVTVPQPLPAQPPMINGTVVAPMVCGNPIYIHKNPAQTSGSGGHGGSAQDKTLPVSPFAYTQSIHNVVAKWLGGTVYRFDIGTAPGLGNINLGHLLNTNEVHTGGQLE